MSESPEPRCACRRRACRAVHRPGRCKATIPARYNFSTCTPCDARDMASYRTHLARQAADQAAATARERAKRIRVLNRERSSERRLRGEQQ